MTNNYILRRLRYTFDFSDANVMKLFAQGGIKATREEISAWLKKDDDPAFVRCTDNQMATFLNGLIIEKRGKKDGPAPVAEHQLNNNIILRKLKIALNFIDDDIIDTLKTAGFRFGKHELSALFRKPDNRQYRECQDQILRNFLQGLQMKIKPKGTDEAPSEPADKAKPATKTTENTTAKPEPKKNGAFQWQSVKKP